MKQKNSGLLRLDILEHGLHQDQKPRYTKTKEIVISLKRKNLFPTEKEAEKEILELQTFILAKKIHHCVDVLTRSLKKAKKLEARKLQAKLKKKEDDSSKTELQILDEKFTEEALDQIAHQKTVKFAEKIFQLKNNVPEYIPDWVKEGVQNKGSNNNSSKFYRDADGETRKVLSKLFQLVLEKVDRCESSLKIVKGPVKKKPVEGLDKRKNKEQEDESESESESENDSESESESEDYSDEENLEKNMDTIDVAEGRKQDFDVVDGEEDYSMYDDLVIASEAESDEEVRAHPDINYNQVTDEEPSEGEEESSQEDDFFDFGDDKKKKDKKEKKEKEKKDKKEKVVLPALQAGYFSGGSESEASDDEKDEVLQNIVKPRKNRRGQRARQKIWEQKFGRNANHVKKEEERVRSERERKRLEYEERVRKREAKQKALEASGGDKANANNTPLGTTRKSGFGDKKKENNEDKPLHPSWIAKRKAEELTKVGFKGKKVKFD